MGVIYEVIIILKDSHLVKISIKITKKRLRWAFEFRITPKIYTVVLVLDFENHPKHFK